MHFLAPEAKGHGVPEVLAAIETRGGRIRPGVVLAKALGSAITIGSGGSVGREGPIAQIGSALGSTIGQVLKLNERRIVDLIASGAAGGIAATFDAPIAGVMFAQEVILGEFGIQTFGTIVVSAVIASVVSRVVLGDSLAFAVLAYALKSTWELLLYLGLEGVSALGALALLCNSVRGSWYVREEHVILQITLTTTGGQDICPKRRSDDHQTEATFGVRLERRRRTRRAPGGRAARAVGSRDPA